MKTKERTSNLKRILSDWYRRDDYSTDHAIDDIYDQFKSSQPSDVSDKELSDIYKLAHRYNFDDFKQFMKIKKGE